MRIYSYSEGIKYHSVGLKSNVIKLSPCYPRADNEKRE